MITVKETTSRELTTPADIVAFLGERYKAMQGGDLAPAIELRARRKEGLAVGQGEAHVLRIRELDAVCA